MKISGFFYLKMRSFGDNFPLFFTINRTNGLTDNLFGIAIGNRSIKHTNTVIVGAIKYLPYLL